MGITQPKPHPQPNIAGSPPSDRNTLQEPKFIEVGSFTPFSFDPTSLDPNSRFGEKFGEEDDPDTPTIPTVFKWSLPAHQAQLSFIGPFAPADATSNSDSVADNKANSSPARPVKFFSALSALIGSGSNGTSTPVASSPPSGNFAPGQDNNSPQSASIPIPLRPIIAPLPILQQSPHVSNSVGTPVGSSYRSLSASTPATPLSYQSPGTNSTSPPLGPQGMQWSEWSPMVKSDGEHMLVHNLRPGRYLYRYKVDGKIRHNPQDSFTSMPQNVLAAATAMIGTTPIANSSDPKLANIVDVRPLHEFSARTAKADLSSSPPGDYGQAIIDFSAPEPASTSAPPSGPVRKGSASSKDREKKKTEPVELPAHLERVLLNTNSVKYHKLTENTGPENSLDVRLDTLPLPHHVMLNHLYFQSRHVTADHVDEASATTKVDEDVLVLGLSLRYKTKYVTTVFYTSMEEEDLIEELPSPPGDANPSLPTSPPLSVSGGSLSPPLKSSEPQQIKPKSFEEHRVIRLDDSPIKFSDGDSDAMPVE